MKIRVSVTFDSLLKQHYTVLLDYQDDELLRLRFPVWKLFLSSKNYLQVSLHVVRNLSKIKGINYYCELVLLNDYINQGHTW